MIQILYMPKLPVRISTIIIECQFLKISFLVELYTYSEEPEFVWNAEAFNNLFQLKCRSNNETKLTCLLFLLCSIDGENKKWKDCSRDEKIDLIVYLLEQCELVNRTRRCQAMRAILYLIQGVFYQCSTIDEYMTIAKENILLLHTCDVVHIFVDLFNMEMNQ